MEDVYIIKVKTKPALSTLYPSERRYSASTVGGLSLVHVIFGTLGLLLGVFDKSFQGIVLFVCCLAPLASGILACKRWYIDRNISIFFYCCLFSAVVSFCCFIGAIYDVSVLTERVVIGKNAGENITYNQTMEMDFDNTTSEANVTILDFAENYTNFESNDISHEEDIDNNERIFLNVNIGIACLLEFIWSLLSIGIALKGMKKEFSESSQRDDKMIKVMTSPLPSRPDIILMNKHICCSMQSLDSLQSLNVQNSYPKLPMPESNREFKERVDKFLTNQVHHRAISDGT